METHNKSKGGFQHRLFKFIILVIVAIFFYLIISFVRIEFSKDDKMSYSFEFNKHRYDYLDKIVKSSFI